MTTLAISCAVRNVQINERKLASNWGEQLRESPDGIAIIERPVALLWAAVFQCINSAAKHQGAM
ncbi:MAG: hypothetical protein ACRC8Q_07430 [Aeromonas sp.]